MFELFELGDGNLARWKTGGMGGWLAAKTLCSENRTRRAARASVSPRPCLGERYAQHTETLAPPVVAA